MTPQNEAMLRKSAALCGIPNITTAVPNATQSRCLDNEAMKAAASIATALTNYAMSLR
jgi:hypothetical protein